MSKELFYKTATELSAMMDAGKITSEELTKAVIERTKSIDKKINAFISFDEEKTLREARESDVRRKSGKRLSKLDGIPVGIKDIISEKGQPLTCASKILTGYVSPYDATVIERMRAAGCVLWGRLNMDEFAMGSSNETSYFGKVANPWDTTRIPGGSSGGSVAAVASGETILALGTDTGGSIRQPASLTGVVGLKPTYGAVSRYGAAAFASSLDQIGPFGRSIEDVASLYQIISGQDDRDCTSRHFEKPDYVKELQHSSTVKKIGLPKEYFGEGLDDEVRKAVDGAVDFYKKHGHEVVEISLPLTEYAIPVYYVIATAEASSNLGRFDGIRYGYRSPAATNAIDVFSKSRGEGFGAEVKRRILLGTFVLSSENFNSYYLRAQKVRTLIQNDFLNAFKHVDAIVTPVSPTTAFEFGKRSTNPLEMYLSDTYTVSANLGGACAISVPCAMSKAGLPIGMQIIGKPFCEHQIMALGYEFEKEHDVKDLHPTI